MKQDNTYVTAKQALEMIPWPMTHAQLVRMSRAGSFPSVGVELNPRVFMWIREEVLEWIAAKLPRAKRVKRGA